MAGTCVMDFLDSLLVVNLIAEPIYLFYPLSFSSSGVTPTCVVVCGRHRWGNINCVLLADLEQLCLIFTSIQTHQKSCRLTKQKHVWKIETKNLPSNNNTFMTLNSNMFYSFIGRKKRCFLYKLISVFSPLFRVISFLRCFL